MTTPRKLHPLLPSFAALCLLSCAGGPPARSSRSSTASESTNAPLPKLLIVAGTNDVHGGILPAPAARDLKGLTSQPVGGAALLGGYLAALRDDARARGGELVWLDGGDEMQGTLVSNAFQGRSVIDAFNAIGLDAAALGNHEFDFGRDVLGARMAQAHYPILAGNVFLRGSRTRPDWIRPTALIERGGLRIGIIGLATRETPIVTNSTLVSDLEFVDPWLVAPTLADELRAQGAQVVLIAAHAGRLGTDEIGQVAQACRGKVDAIVAGHTHEMFRKPVVVAGIPIIQSGTKLSAFSFVELTLDAQGHATSFQINPGATPTDGAPQVLFAELRGAAPTLHGRPVAADAKVATLLAGYDSQVRALREKVVGSSEVPLRASGEPALLANLVADALRSGAGGGLPADFALQNQGGLRVPSIPRGPITYGQLFDLYPFDNQEVVVELTAQDLRDLLEGVVRAGKKPLRASGFRYAVDYQRFGAAADLAHSRPGSLVTGLWSADGQLLCETLRCEPGAPACESHCAQGPHTLALTDFLINGGDGVKVPKAAKRQIGSVLTRELVVAYVQAHQPLTAALLGAQEPPRVVVKGEVEER